MQLIETASCHGRPRQSGCARRRPADRPPRWRRAHRRPARVRRGPARLRRPEPIAIARAGAARASASNQPSARRCIATVARPSIATDHGCLRRRPNRNGPCRRRNQICAERQSTRDVTSWRDRPSMAQTRTALGRRPRFLLRRGRSRGVGRAVSTRTRKGKCGSGNGTDASSAVGLSSSDKKRYRRHPRLGVARRRQRGAPPDCSRMVSESSSPRCRTTQCPKCRAPARSWPCRKWRARKAGCSCRSAISCATKSDELAACRRFRHAPSRARKSRCPDNRHCCCRAGVRPNSSPASSIGVP